MHQFSEIVASSFGSCALVSKKFGPIEVGLKMEEYHKTVRETFEKIVGNQGQGKMLFINHGDSWYNNFLYR
jgi:hypothetical protein